MNRSLDYRTDLYSLGVTLYRLLTGQLPFRSKDAMELVHSHIAKVPKPPFQVIRGQDKSPFEEDQGGVAPNKPKAETPGCPKVLSDIILKLVSKNAEDRYQSAFGLKTDLQNCFQQLKETGQIEEFEIGLHDISDHLNIPQKLYGRETETQTLLSAFDRVSHGQSEMMLVAGYSGVGKSSLVREIHQPIVQRRGYFISGKFDQFQRNIPYTALVQAFQEMIRQIMTESSQRFSTWKEKLQKALGSNGQVIIDVIPDVEKIIGKQSKAPELRPEENRNRFRYVLQNFIGVFAAADRPLVLFLDDLQWAGLPSLQSSACSTIRFHEGSAFWFYES